MRATAPRMRPLEAIPFEQEGRLQVALRDPLHISSEILVVSPHLYHLLTLLDGRRTLEQLRSDLVETSGVALPPGHLEEIVARLDQAYFLDNDRFHDRRRGQLEAFRLQPVRPAAHCGQSYPEEGPAVTDLLDGFYARSGGPPTPPATRRESPAALVAPHIDLRLGGTTYTAAYRRLAEGTKPDLFLILGIAHSGLPHLFSVSRKDFRTPLGTSRCDRDFLAELDRVAGPGCDTFAEELAHRDEHSIEFQVLFLQHLYGADNVLLAPVLCSFSWENLEDPGWAAEFRDFVATLRRVLEQMDRRVCVIASVDLAHIGPRYGDRSPPGPADLVRVKARDRTMLNSICAGDPESFRASIRDENDARRICGFSALYTTLHLLGDCRGELLAHDHCEIDESGSLVTYASLALQT